MSLKTSMSGLGKLEHFAMGFRAFLDNREARTHGYEEAARSVRFLAELEGGDSAGR